MTSLERMTLWFELNDLQEAYVSVLDNDRLEDWPALFVEDCEYAILPKENADMGLPAGIMWCNNQRMLRDRIVSLRNANIFEAHTYRHMTSGLRITPLDADTVDMTASYVVIQTRVDGVSEVYQAGRYEDRVVRTPEGWRYAKKRVIYDSSRVQTLLATPI